MIRSVRAGTTLPFFGDVPDLAKVVIRSNKKPADGPATRSDPDDDSITFSDPLVEPGIRALWLLQKTEMEQGLKDMEVSPAPTSMPPDDPSQGANPEEQPGIPPTCLAMVAHGESASPAEQPLHPPDLADGVLHPRHVVAFNRTVTVPNMRRRLTNGELLPNGHTPLIPRLLNVKVVDHAPPQPSRRHPVPKWMS